MQLILCMLSLIGAYGECGLRGGYMELHNMDPDVLDELYKIASINLSPNTPGQVDTPIYPIFQNCIDTIIIMSHLDLRLTLQFI